MSRSSDAKEICRILGLDYYELNTPGDMQTSNIVVQAAICRRIEAIEARLAKLEMPPPGGSSGVPMTGFDVTAIASKTVNQDEPPVGRWQA